MKRAIVGLLAPAVGAALFGFGCEEKKPSPEVARADAEAADKYATADPKLEKALQSAADASGAAENGPPPDGIFAPGAADRRHARGLPTKFDLVNDGAEPRIALAPATDAGRPSAYGPASLELAMQMGPRTAAPTIDLTLSISPAKDDEGGADWLVAAVKRAAPARQQLGQLPSGTDKEIASLEGTRVRVRLTPNGCESDVQMELGKTSRPELDRLAQSAAEALVLATVPLPSKPVGVGAQWFAETRMPLSGADVIAYRAYQVKSIDGDRVRLALNLKAYSTSKDTRLQGVPPGSTLEQFDAEGQGEVEAVRGESVARTLDLQQRVVMVFQAPGSPQTGAAPGQPQANVLTAQLQSRAAFARGDDLRAAMRP